MRWVKVARSCSRLLSQAPNGRPLPRLSNSTPMAKRDHWAVDKKLTYENSYAGSLINALARLGSKFRVGAKLFNRLVLHQLRWRRQRGRQFRAERDHRRKR